jgi:hypothetical protein
MNLPEGATIEVLVADLPLWLARDYTDDRGEWWKKTRLPIMAAFRLSPDDYWDLTVLDHAEMAAYLKLV